MNFAKQQKLTLILVDEANFRTYGGARPSSVSLMEGPRYGSLLQGIAFCQQ